MKKNGRKKPKKSRVITKPALRRAVELVGGVKTLALEIGVSMSNISEWTYTNRPIPAHHVHKIVKATKGKVTAEQLRPDVFVD